MPTRRSSLIALAARSLAVLGLLSNESVAQWQPQWNGDPDGDGMNGYVTAYSSVALQLIDRHRRAVLRGRLRPASVSRLTR